MDSWGGSSSSNNTNNTNNDDDRWNKNNNFAINNKKKNLSIHCGDTDFIQLTHELLLGLFDHQLSDYY